MNVLYIIDGLHGGGKERQLVEVIKSLPGNKFNIGVITFNKNKHYTDFVKKNVSYFVELKKKPTGLEPFFSIWKHLIKFKPDIIHTWDSLSSLYVLIPKMLLNIKLVNGSIRDAGIEKGWEYSLKRFLLKRSDLIISNSIAGLNYYKVMGKVIYNGIDMHRFKQNNKLNKFNIIMTANFTDYKDHDTFLKAAVVLKNENIIDEIYLAGEGPNLERYKNWVNNSYPPISKSFHFLGRIYNVEDYLQNCKVGVLCSTSKFGEGISNAILEYMAAGLVPIATKTGGSVEIIEDGVNGFFIAESDSNSIIRNIKHLKQNPQKFNDITKAAQNNLLEKFNYENCVQRFEKTYIELLH